MREAPSRVLMESLWEAGAKVRAYDPEAMDEAARIYADQQGLTLCESAYDALEGADALVIVTEWQEFRSPDFDELKSTLTDPVIFDGRNLYDPGCSSCRASLTTPSAGATWIRVRRRLSAGAKPTRYCPERTADAVTTR